MHQASLRTHRLSGGAARLRRRPALIAAVAAVALLLPTLAVAGPWGYLVSSDGKTRTPLEKSAITIGSGARADVRVQDGTVSKRHARILRKRGLVYVKDLGSRSGTLVAGTLLRKGRSMQIFRKTLVTVGAVTLTFEWGDRGKIIAPLLKSKKTKKVRGSKKAQRAKRAPKAAGKGPVARPGKAGAKRGK